MSSAAPVPSVFISYSHQDEHWLERLLVHLKPLARAGTIVPWADTRLRSGDRWRAEIAQAIAGARVAVLLVSADFLASDFIAGDELPPLLDAARFKGLRIIPVVLSPCRFEQTPSLSALQALNPPSRALNQMTKPQREEYFVKLSVQIEAILAPSPDAAPDRGTRPDSADPHNLVAQFPDPRGGGYVRSVSDERVVNDQVGENIPIFARRGTQWAVIIGTDPPWLWNFSPPPLSVEIIDAVDVLDWFWSPDVYGPIAPDHLFVLTGTHATSKAVSEAMASVAAKIKAEDSVLFYFSGHATESDDSGLLVLHDAPNVQRGDTMTDRSTGVLPARKLVDWCNRLRAEKVVCILDSGGHACYKAGSRLKAGRYFLSALNCRYTERNGVFTWYVRRVMNRMGRDIMVSQLHQVLTAVDEVLDAPLNVYLRGRDRSPG